MSKYKRAMVLPALFLAAFLSGCELLDDFSEQIDPPQTVTYTEDEVSTEGEDKTQKVGSDKKTDGAKEKTVMTELYLIDKNGYVVPKTMALPNTKSVAKQALEYLVKDGPVTELLPDGFRAVLPPGTEMTVDMRKDTAIVDFSKEFKNYKPEEEEKILQAVTWTLTQFEPVEKVKIKLNGEELTEMPVAGTPIGKFSTRAQGINVDTTEAVDITNTKAITVYYLAGEENGYYYVPVTKRVSKDSGNDVKQVVQELVKGPSPSSNLLTDFLPDVALIDEPIVADGEVTLNFNEYIYSGADGEKRISDHLLNMLVLSLTELEGIEKVSLLVNGEKGLVKENGEKLVEPVTRPEKVNTGSF